MWYLLANGPMQAIAIVPMFPMYRIGVFEHEVCSQLRPSPTCTPSQVSPTALSKPAKEPVKEVLKLCVSTNTGNTLAHRCRSRMYVVCN